MDKEYSRSVGKASCIMNLEELFKVCPPTRTLKYPKTLSKDIEQLKLKRQNLPNESPIFVDSADLVYLLTKQVKTYKEYTPYDLLTLIHYKKFFVKDNQTYYYRISRPIHYGWYNREKAFTVQSASVTDPQLLNSKYNQAIRETRNNLILQIELQVATYDDVLILNRRLIPFNIRVMSRMPDRKLVAFKFDWTNGELL